MIGALGLVLAFAVATDAADDRPPNVVLIVTDDQGTVDLNA